MKSSASNLPAGILRSCARISRSEYASSSSAQLLHLAMTVLRDEFLHPPLADAACTDLRIQVAFALLRRAHVVQDQRQDLLVQSRLH